jgi:hypothetical protein
MQSSRKASLRLETGNYSTVVLFYAVNGTGVRSEAASCGKLPWLLLLHCSFPATGL